MRDGHVHVFNTADRDRTLDELRPLLKGYVAEPAAS